MQNHTEMSCRSANYNGAAASQPALALRFSVDAAMHTYHKPVKPSSSLAHKLGRSADIKRRHTCSSGSQASPRPRPIITRIDKPWEHPRLPAAPVLDIEAIIRRREDQLNGCYAGNIEETPPSASAESSYTLVNSPLPGDLQSGSSHRPASSISSASAITTATSSGDSATIPVSLSPESTHQGLCGALISSAMLSRPSTAGGLARPSIGAAPGGRRLRHRYFPVATMDGEPTIPDMYDCPDSMCEQRFACFSLLQSHWSSEHPWNRGDILTPVCREGMRRLGWWEHKKRYIWSVVHGAQIPEIPEDFDPCRSSNDGTTADRKALRRRALSMDKVCKSDYRDISLFGTRTYPVSPRVVPMWQVVQWEAERDAKARQ